MTLKPLNKYLLQKTFKFEEEVDMDKFKIIIDNYGEEMGLMRDNSNGYSFISAQESLPILRKMYQDRLKSKLVIYKQTKSSPDGRFFSQGASLQGIPRKIRHTIAKSLYYDIDIKNCHPVLLRWYCQENDIPCDSIDYYINNREQCFQELGDLMNETKDIIKSNLLAIMNGGGTKKYERFLNQAPVWFVDYISQMKNIHESIVKLNPELYKTVLKQCKANGKDFNIEGSLVNRILCKYENNVLLHMMYFCESKGVKISSMCFDGKTIYKDSVEDLNSLLKQMKTFVTKKTGIVVEIVNKEMDEDLDLTGLVAKEEEEEDEEEVGESYESIKKVFEQTHFKCIETGTYYEIRGDKLTIRNPTKLHDCYCHMKYKGNLSADKLTNFIDRWVRDPKIRAFENVGFYPPPLRCPDEYFNLWTGFRIERVDLNDLSEDELKEVKEDFEFLLKHFELIFGDECYDFAMKWNALMIQKPGTRPNVMIMLKSLQGLGKDAWVKIMAKIFGDKYVLKAQNIERDVLGDFNGLIDGKIFLCLDEMNMSVSAKLADAIKDLVTDEISKINKKGISQYDTLNCLHTVSFSNGDFPWKITEDDRRSMAIDRSNIQPLESSYYDKLFTIIENDYAIRMLFDHFMTVDISKFNAKNDRPKTEFMDELKELSRPIETQFMIDYISLQNNDVEIFSNALLEQFKEYLKENYVGINYSTNAIKFGLKLKKLNITGATKRTSTGNKARWSFDIFQCKQWLHEKKYVVEEPLTSLLRSSSNKS